MTSYTNLIEKIADRENIRLAIMNSSKGKRNREDVTLVLNNIDHYIEIVRNMIINETFKIKKHIPQQINDGFKQKKRMIIKPDYQYEQIIHHAVIQILIPIFTKGMYAYTCGSIPNRGAHYGQKYIESALKNDSKNTKYVFKCDIHHFFESIDQNILKEMLKKKIRDRKLLRLLYKIIEATPKGLPLGYYTSQWFANWYLQGLDHYIKETLHVKYMVRYMDDIVCFGANKKELHRVKDAIMEYLHVNLNLELKGNWQIFRMEHDETEVEIKYTSTSLPLIEEKLRKSHIKYRVVCNRKKHVIIITNQSYQRNIEGINNIVTMFSLRLKIVNNNYGHYLDFMGFKFYRHKTTLRKNIAIRSCKKARKMFKKGIITWFDAASMLSYLGYYTHTDCYGMFKERIIEYVSPKKLRKVVSNHSKKMVKENNNL